MFEYITYWKKIYHTKTIVQVLSYGTAQPKVNFAPFEIQKFQQSTKNHIPTKKIFTRCPQPHLSPWTSFIPSSFPNIPSLSQHSPPGQIYILLFSVLSPSWFLFFLRFLRFPSTFWNLPVESTRTQERYAVSPCFCQISPSVFLTLVCLLLCKSSRFIC